MAMVDNLHAKDEKLACRGYAVPKSIGVDDRRTGVYLREGWLGGDHMYVSSLLRQKLLKAVPTQWTVLSSHTDRPDPPLVA